MIEHIWSVLCSQSIIDKDSNNITLFDVIERLTATGPPGEGVVPISLELVTLWGRQILDQPARGRARFRLLGPDDTQVAPINEYDVDLTMFSRLRHKVRINGFPIHGSGKYKFLVELEEDRNWRRVAQIPLEVVQENIPQPPQPQQAN